MISLRSAPSTKNLLPKQKLSFALAAIREKSKFQKSPKYQ
jgi:hypothetical protein